ncbi:MAG: DUF1844 domain-containing protein [Syntrophobacterales bacterium]|nr:DUF1844 domain-containing protein [Syntrophobacterales bacterium]
MSDNNEEKGFSVKDKRIFTEEGNLRPEAPQKDEKKEQGEKVADAKEAEKPEGKVNEETIPLPEINFPSFILSLHTSALYNFGDLKNPASGEKVKNLPAAKQTIDIMGILKEKTSGNLDQYEQRLLDGALYELRMRYVKETENK